MPLITNGKYLLFNAKRFFVMDNAIVSNSTNVPVEALSGSMGTTKHATGLDKIFVSDGTKWQEITIGSGGIIPQNSQSADYTLVLADSGKHILHPSADTTPRTFTIPANASVAYPIGTALTIVNQNGAGSITVAVTTDTQRLAGAGTTGNRTLAPNGIGTWLKIATTEWLASGTGLT